MPLRLAWIWRTSHGIRGEALQDVRVCMAWSELEQEIPQWYDTGSACSKQHEQVKTRMPQTYVSELLYTSQ